MKNTRSFLLVFLFILMGLGSNLLLADGPPGGVYMDWTETIFRIYTKADLDSVAVAVNNPNNWWKSSGKYFYLESDIYGFTGTIGTNNSPFMGTFHGKEHVIGVNINKPNDVSVGLFGKADGANISNLIIIGTVVGKNHVGGILGQGQNVWIERCTNLASVTAQSSYYLYSGNNTDETEVSTLNDLIPPDGPTSPPPSTLDPSVHGGYSAGGIAGHSDIGGITIVRCVNDGCILGVSSIGGIVGYGCDNTEIFNCINIGTVQGRGDAKFIGGIAGNRANTIGNSLNGGFVVGKNNVGGIAGNCGSVSACTIIKYCLNTGVVYGNQNTGSITGNMPVTTNAINNFYDKQMSSKGGINGVDIANRIVGKTTFELTGNNLSAWGGSFWKMHTSQLYPVPSNVGCIRGYNDYHTSHMECVAAATLKLQSSPFLETADNMQANIFYTHTPASPVNWTAKLCNVKINGPNGIYYSSIQNGAMWDTHGPADRRDTMVATRNVYSKQVPIYIPGAIQKSASFAEYTTNYSFTVSEVTPSIVTDNATIDIQTATEGNLNVSIYDLAGTKVANITDRYVNTNSELQINLNNLAGLSTGSYMAVVSVGNEVVMRKFVKG